MPRFDRVSYQKVFPLGMYINERLGVEMQLDEGDDANEALATAKALVEEFHIENNKGLYFTMNPDAITNAESKSPKESAQTDMIAAINSCTDIKVLESYRLIAKSNPEFQEAYDKKLKELNA